MEEQSGKRVNGGLEDSVGTMGIGRFEMDAKVVDKKDKLDKVWDRGEEFVHVDEERSAAQRGGLRDLIELVVGRGEVIGNS